MRGARHHDGFRVSVMRYIGVDGKLMPRTGQETECWANRETDYNSFEIKKEAGELSRLVIAMSLSA